MKTLLRGSFALVSFLLSAAIPGWGHAFADDYCVELTPSEFPPSALRRADDNYCHGNTSVVNTAADRALTAIEPQCVNNITLQIAAHACTRVNKNLNTSSLNWWGTFPPSAIPSADKGKIFPSKHLKRERLWRGA